VGEPLHTAVKCNGYQSLCYRYHRPVRVPVTRWRQLGRVGWGLEVNCLTQQCSAMGTGGYRYLYHRPIRLPVTGRIHSVPVTVPLSTVNGTGDRMETTGQQDGSGGSTVGNDSITGTNR